MMAPATRAFERLPLPTYCLLLSAYCLLPTAYCLLPTALRGPVRAGPQLLHLLGKLPHHLREPRPFRCRNPFQAKALLFDAEVRQHQANSLRALFRLQVAFLIVTISRVAAAHEHAIRSLREGLDDQVGVDHSRAHHPDDPDARWILDSGDTRQVSARKRAPVAAQRDNQRLECLVHDAAPRAAWIWALIWSSVNPLMMIPHFGQVAWQHPQPLQIVALASTTFFTDPCHRYSNRVIALNGQVSTQ